VVVIGGGDTASDCVGTATLPFLLPSMRSVAAWNSRSAPSAWLDEVRILVAQDCVGTAFRQGALSVTQLDIRPRPPEREDKLTVWPPITTTFLPAARIGSSAVAASWPTRRFDWTR
jgi:hypothetical protein